jgi:hypothetical protein
VRNSEGVIRYLRVVFMSLDSRKGVMVQEILMIIVEM